MEHFLRVATNGQNVGQLGFESLHGQYSFYYEPAWQKQKNAFSAWGNRAPRLRRSHRAVRGFAQAARPDRSRSLPTLRSRAIASMTSRMRRTAASMCWLPTAP